MKRLLVLLTIVTFSLNAENVAYVPYRTNTTGIPDFWPATVPRLLGEEFGPLLVGEIVTNRAWLEAFVASNAPIMAARKRQLQTNASVLVRKQQIVDTINDLTLALNNWATLNAAQKDAVLKRVAQVIQILLAENRVDTNIR